MEGRVISMRFQKVAGSSHPSYIVNGWDGEEQYYIYTLWDEKQQKVLGYEIYEVNGCYQKLGTVDKTGQFAGYGAFAKRAMLKENEDLAEIIKFCKREIIGIRKLDSVA